MDEITRYLLSGLSYGMLLFLIASGLSLVLGVMGILNLAHGSLYMIGAFVGVLLMQNVNVPWWLALFAAGAAAGLTGVVMERVLLRRLHGKYNEQVLLTLGLVYVFGNLALWVWGSYPLLGRPPDFLSASIPIGRLNFPEYRLAILLLGLLVAGGLWWFQERTRAGSIIRAGMDDREMTAGLGVNYGLLCSGVFALGSAMAGFAGYLGAPLLGAKWDMAFAVLLSAMIVVVIGGVGRVEGTLAGALLVGLLDNLGKIFFPQFAMFTIYLLFILVLLIRPAGLLGRMTAGGNESAPAQAAPVSAAWPAAGREGSMRWLPVMVLAAVALALLLLPQFASAYFRSMLTEILIYGLFALSLNVLFGYTGLFSLGHGAFFGLGAYLAGFGMLQLGYTNIWIILPSVLILVALVAAVAAVVALRTTGVYFLFVTLAIGELFASLALKWTDVTGGSNGLFGIPYPDLGFALLGPDTFYYFVLTVCASCAFLLHRLVHSPFGLALQGIRDDERRMQHLGYHTQLCKLVAFVSAGAAAGVAGALYASFSGTVVPGYAGAMTSTLVMLMVILGGPRQFFGPVVGSAVVVALQYYASLYFPDRWHLILGSIFVLSVLLLRGGLLATGQRLVARLPGRRFSHERP